MQEQFVCRLYVLGVPLPAMLTPGELGAAALACWRWEQAQLVFPGWLWGWWCQTLLISSKDLGLRRRALCGGKGNRRIVTLRSWGIGHRVSCIPTQSIVHSMHSLLKAFLVWAGWKGWRGEGQKGGVLSFGAQKAELAAYQRPQGHTLIYLRWAQTSKFLSGFWTGNLVAEVHFQ